MLNRIVWFVVLMVIWLILFSHIDLLVILSGIAVCIFAIWFTETYLLKKPLVKKYPINPIALLAYLIFLVYQIYKSGFETIGLIVNGDVNPKIVHIKTSLKKPYLRALLANSITLTPGTVTVDLDGEDLLVLWLNPTTEDSEEAGDIIKGRLEEWMKRGSL